MSNRFNPKVSIVIPVYNGSNYVKEAIDSALSQTYENIEVIVINDGSNDKGKTEKICKSYGKRIRYFKKENGGVASALNMGIEKMEGEYFSWLSHDDVYYPEKIEKQIEYLSNLENRSNIVLYANYELIDANSKLKEKVVQDHSLLQRKPEYALLRGRINGITLLILKKAFDIHGKFNEELKCTQDYDMWRRISKTYTFVHMDEILTKTRIHPLQDSNKHPNVVTEGDPLWISMMEDLSKEDKERLEGTEYNFYRLMRNFLQNNSLYTGAISHTKRKMKKIMDKTSYKKIENKKVSIIIPFYNEIEELKNAIGSVFKQTHKNLEIILINDGSTDNLEELQKIVKQDSRTKLINLEVNSGPGKARNTGIKESKGEYIAFLDADDTFLPEKIRIQLLEMYLTGGKISHTSYIKKENTREETVETGKLDGKVIPEIIRSCTIATPTVMVERKYLKESAILFREDIRIGEDTCFWLELLRNMNLEGIDNALTVVNINSESASTNLSRHLEGLTNILGYLLTDKEYSFFHEQISHLCQRYTQVSSEIVFLKKGKDFNYNKGQEKNKFKKLLYLFKYQGVLLTIKKIIWKYGPKIFNEKDKNE